MKRVRPESETPSWNPTDNFGQPCKTCKKGIYINDPRSSNLKCSDCGDEAPRWNV